MIGLGHSRWRFAVLPIVASAPLLGRSLASVPLSPSFLLAVAGALLVTTVVVGVYAWRNASVADA